MSKKWQVQDAESRFNEMLEASLTEGPQVVTESGVETAVLLPIEQWRQLEKKAMPNLKELLLAPEARTGSLTPPRTKHRHRLPWPIDSHTGSTHIEGNRLSHDGR